MGGHEDKRVVAKNVTKLQVPFVIISVALHSENGKLIILKFYHTCIVLHRMNPVHLHVKRFQFFF